ncbi:hypothetical protein HDU87_007839 [Geranomyces variabilis]|uniref:Nucleoside diphosphate kinase n=1 Tax=Geranomyces variabilis TaxID=109894 RepID=A0AAD5TFZ7_9FUNG|nr:hypothetical protein HDU87_007839 [Geranomyces variabilis]
MTETLDAQFNEFFANSSQRVESDLENARRAPHYPAGETTTRPTLTRVYQATADNAFGRFIPATTPGLRMDDIKSADLDQLLAKFGAQEAASTPAPSTPDPLDEVAQQKKKKKKNKPKKKRSSSLKQTTSPSPTPTVANAQNQRLKEKDDTAKVEQPAAGPTPRSPIAAALAAEPISTPADRRNSGSRAHEEAMTAAPILANTDLPTDTYQVMVSPTIPPCLYAAMLEEMTSGGFIIQALHRRSELFAQQGAPWLAYKEWREHTSACLSFTFAVHLSKKPSHSSLTTAACTQMLTLWAQKVQKSELLRGSEFDTLRKLPCTEFFHVSRDGKTRNQNLLAESSERKLPFLDSAETRLSRASSHEPQFCDELPQVGFMAARSAFATPLMKKILEAGSGFELLGMKYLKDISPARARYLTPYVVGDVAWASSLDHITSTQEGQGWFLLVVRKADALNDMHKIVDEYLESYLRISAHNDTPEIGRRRRSIHTKAEPVIEETMESLRLQVIVSPNIDSSYAQTTVFFRDAELVPRGLPDVNERARHPPWFLYDPLVTKTMTENAPLLFTVCVLKQAAFPMLGDVLAQIRAAEFEISSVKCTHVNQVLARRMFRTEDINKPAADVLDPFAAEISEGPVIIFSLQRENAISKWMKIMDVLRSKSSVPTKPGSVFEGGIYASTTWSAASAHRNTLFSEGATTKVRYIRDNHKMHKILQQTDMVTTLPVIPRALVYTRRREEAVVSPPPSPTAAEMNPPELVCVTLLPAHRTTSDTYASWERIVNAILLEPDTVKQPSPVPPDQTEKGKPGSKRRKRRHVKGAKSPDCTAPPERASPEPASETKAPPPARVVACRYLVLGPDAITEWSKYCPQVECKKFKSQVAQGACLALAVETDDAARIATAVAGLPQSDRRCVAFTKTCEEACGQLPIMFGELFDSFYKIVTERTN